MADIDDTPLIKAAAAIRGSGAPDRKGRRVLKEMIESGEIKPRNGFLSPNDVRKLDRALNGPVAA